MSRLPAAIAALLVMVPGLSQAQPSSGLTKGTYPCYGSIGYLHMDLRILGPDAYADKQGKQGRYRIDPATQKIAFLSGPLQSVNGIRFDASRVGLNMTGGSFYSVTCTIQR